jgi:hypothetical protein
MFVTSLLLFGWSVGRLVGPKWAGNGIANKGENSVFNNFIAS